jgi:acyl-CoA thioester hydrolase
MYYVVAETNVRYKAPIYFEDTLHCSASIRTVGNRSFIVDHELHVGESYENGRTVAEGTSAQVFYDPKTEEVRRQPEWFLATVAGLENRAEESFAPSRGENS